MSESKQAFQRIHAKNRALERHGLDYDDAMREELVGKIQSGRDATFLESQSQRVSMWAVRHEGKVYAVVYDKQTKEIATFMPDSYLNRYKDLLRE
jgi:hypothetical protein